MSKYGVSFWLVFCRILTAYGNLIREPPYSAQIRENTDQKKLVFRHFSRLNFLLSTQRKNRGLQVSKYDNTFEVLKNEAS